MGALAKKQVVAALTQMMASILSRKFLSFFNFSRSSIESLLKRASKSFYDSLGKSFKNFAIDSMFDSIRPFSLGL